MHHFDEDLATRFGVLEAVLLYNIAWWIKKNEANGVHQHDGNTWTYNSIKAFCKLFPYASEKQLRRALEHLVEEGVLLKGNFNTSSYDRTLWYAFAPEWKSICLTGKVHLPSRENGFAPEGEPIPDNKPDINHSDNKPDSKQRINYLSIVDMYNEICISFPRIRSLSESRKRAIKARLNTYTIDDFRKLFENAEASDFLKGKNNRNWSATFDWLIQDSNMAKVLDGNYAQSCTRKSKAAQEMDDFYAMVTEWANEKDGLT